MNTSTTFYTPPCFSSTMLRSYNSICKITNTTAKPCESNNHWHRTPIRYASPATKHNILEQYQPPRCSNAPASCLQASATPESITWGERDARGEESTEAWKQRKESQVFQLLIIHEGLTALSCNSSNDEILMPSSRCWHVVQMTACQY